MDITGARWGLEGAEAILKLRAPDLRKQVGRAWRDVRFFPAPGYA
jgi:hypothetical protein